MNPIRRSPTMADVAAEAGVSVMTVSRVLRGMGGAVPEKAKRVREAAKRLGYRPDPLVGALMAARRRNREPGFHGVVALVNTHSLAVKDSNARVRGLFQGAAAQAAKSGYRLEEFHCLPEEGALRGLLKSLRARGVPGILWMHFRNPGFRMRVDLRPFACATYGFSLDEPRLHRASDFQLDSMQQVLEKLARRGCRRAGYVTFRQAEARVHRQWAAGWMEYRLQAPEVEWLEPLVLDLERYAEARRAFEDWFGRHRPEAVVAPFGEALEWLEGLGVRVPGQVGFALLDAEPGGRASGIDQQWDRIGAAAVDLITGQLGRNERGIPESAKLMLVPGRWQEGRTLPKRFAAAG